jgi:hypothetical protein
MSCLTGYIGLKYCGEANSPQSSLYINTLEGINLDLLAKLSEGEQKGFIDVWNDIQERAIMRISDDITGYLNTKYSISTIQKSINLLRNLNSDTSVVTGKKWQGITIDIRTGTGDYVNSALNYITIQTVSVKVVAADTGSVTNLKVFDLLTGEVLFTKSVTLTTGWNTIQVNQKFTNDYTDRGKYVFCALDFTGIESFTKTVNEELYDLTVRGAYSDVVTGLLIDDVTTGNDTFGMSAVITQGCSYDAVICNNKEVFKRAFFYCLGVETMLECLASNRMSKYTTTGRDRAEKNIENYKLEYQNALSRTLDGLTLSLNDTCLECHSTYTVKNILP